MVDQQTHVGDGYTIVKITGVANVAVHVEKERERPMWDIIYSAF